MPRVTWTPEFLAFVLPMTPEHVLALATGDDAQVRAEIAWIQTAQRLAWQYGEAEAVERLNAPPEPDAGRLIDRVAA